MIEKEPLVSIIMPAFNCEKYVVAAIYSVLTQTYKNWELLVIDDGSNDNTYQIIKDFSQKDSRIKAFTNIKNLGVSVTRNRGIELASAQWIAFIDSDDIWNSFKLEKQLKFAEKNSAEFLFTAQSYMNEEGNLYKGIFEVPEIITFKKLKKQNVISCSSVLLKKNFFENIKMEKDELHEDYVVWLRILKLGVTAYGVNEPLHTIRISRNSKSGNKFKSLIMTYKVFRYFGENPIGSIYFMSRHVLAAAMKYNRVFASGYVKSEG